MNKSKRENILKFLKECQEVQNKLYEYYWNNSNYKSVIYSQEKMDFNRLCIKSNQVEPKLKSHHYQQISQQVFSNLKSVQSNIINNSMRFVFNDKIKQSIYNYSSKFCFNWNDLEQYIIKQLKKSKKKDVEYINFLGNLKEFISNEENYTQMKQDIESKFWEIKNQYKCPIKKEFQILCNSAHTVDIDKTNYYQWIFMIDNNDRIGGTERKGVFDKLVIPVKYTDYHKELLKDKKLDNTFNLKLNRYGQIEIIASYEIEIEYPTPNEIKDEIGVDIGLKKLITTSDGEIINQNSKIIHKADKVIKNLRNRQALEKYLQKKLNDDTYKISNKRHLIKQAGLTNFVKCDNRYKIKRFLKSRPNDHIVMEDLDISYSKTFNKKVNYLLRRMHIQGLKIDILKYSKEYGNTVSIINPAFTSQQCPVCGYIDKKNRPTQEMFCCVKCGHTDNADHNASVNIKNRFYDNRIDLKTPTWKVKEILSS